MVFLRLSLVAFAALGWMTASSAKADLIISFEASAVSLTPGQTIAVDVMVTGDGVASFDTIATDYNLWEPAVGQFQQPTGLIINQALTEGYDLHLDSEYVFFGNSYYGGVDPLTYVLSAGGALTYDETNDFSEVLLGSGDKKLVTKLFLTAIKAGDFVLNIPANVEMFYGTGDIIPTSVPLMLSVSAVPEPASAGMVCLGAIAIALRLFKARWRKPSLAGEPDQ